MRQNPSILAEVRFDESRSQNRYWNVYTWENSEFTPAVFGAYDLHCGLTKDNFPWPVKILSGPNWIAWWGPQCTVVRTDVYPLLWVAVLTGLRLRRSLYEIQARTIWPFMRFCNKIGLAHTPVGSRFSWRDFFPVDTKQILERLRSRLRQLESDTAIAQGSYAPIETEPVLLMAPDSDPINNSDCKYYNRPSYPRDIRCAVNPSGQCDGCPDFEERR